MISIDPPPGQHLDRQEVESLEIQGECLSELSKDPSANIDESEPPTGVKALGDTVQNVTLAAFNGRLNTPGGLKYYQNKTLKPKHMKILRLAACGYSNREIVALLAKRGITYTEARVSVILRHPYAQQVLATMCSRAVDNLDTLEMIKGSAPEMAQLLINTARDTSDENVRVKVGFGLLDRAGFGPKKTVEIEDKTTPQDVQVASTVLDRFAAALEKASKLKEVPYERGQRLFSNVKTVENESPSACLPSTGNSPNPGALPASSSSPSSAMTSRAEPSREEGALPSVLPSEHHPDAALAPAPVSESATVSNESVLGDASNSSACGERDAGRQEINAASDLKSDASPDSLLGRDS